jgi:hypothetical protein
MDMDSVSSIPAAAVFVGERVDKLRSVLTNSFRPQFADVALKWSDMKI